MMPGLHSARKKSSQKRSRGPGRVTGKHPQPITEDYDKYPMGGVPAEEPGVTYLTDYDKQRYVGRRQAIDKEYPRAYDTTRRPGRQGVFERKKRPPTSKELEGRIRAYANQPILAYADPENVAKERRKKRLRSRGAGRTTVLGNGSETLG